MSDFRRQFVDTSAATEKQGSDDTGVHAYAASGSASRGLPYISEDMASNDNIDDIPDWGISSRGLSSQGTRDDRFSVDSKSSVTRMTSINSINTAFGGHNSGADSDISPCNADVNRKVSKVRISPSN